jgi:hypothetical protein
MDLLHDLSDYRSVPGGAPKGMARVLHCSMRVALRPHKAAGDGQHRVFFLRTRQPARVAASRNALDTCAKRAGDYERA